ncbi:hypothetical protein NM208_g3725 [Fusarium decemcellulare]|uniref:Uncharacterized protein n=1 Tax=Fusarium decemcellulare TaxID=57161 RepID=A0ACC1SN98_9HYPO|nr:hypothetical protein NM208_g3725 [Fusarium decemcellulare]
MSFGFSIGDFLAAGRLINDIVSSLRHASASSYQELILELHGLKRALDGIEHLECPPGKEAAVNGVKIAALQCQYPLDEFASKLKKYERLDIQRGSSSKSDRLKGWGRRVQWGVSMEEDVAQLRAYIATHVGSLNMRLITIGLSTTFLNREQSCAETSVLQSKLEEVCSGVVESRREQTQHGLIITKVTSLLEHLCDLVSTGIGVRLETLIRLAQNIWKSNLQIMTVVTQLQSQPPRPDTSRTWFQDPVRFEDALGRVLPIPSEYGWSKVHAIIVDQFSTGPGSDKVKAKEYLLFNSLDSSQILLEPHTKALTPGMSITMAVIIGRYGSTPLDNCPRIGCVSRQIEASKAGGKFWFVLQAQSSYAPLLSNSLPSTLCRCWFNSTSKRIALPPRPERTLPKRSTTEYIPRRRLCQMRHAITKFNSTSPSSFNDQREEGRSFKNILIHFMDLPGTPSIVIFWGRAQNSASSIRSECGWAVAPSIISESGTIQSDTAILDSLTTGYSYLEWTRTPDDNDRNLCQCGKAFRRPSDLAKHQKYHIKFFACRFSGCDKVFAIQKDLTRHMRVHRKDKVWQCNVKGCRKALSGHVYSRKENFDRHMRTTHPEFPHV